jgi:hypothetical protein
MLAPRAGIEPATFRIVPDALSLSYLGKWGRQGLNLLPVIRRAFDYSPRESRQQFELPEQLPEFTAHWLRGQCRRNSTQVRLMEDAVLDASRGAVVGDVHERLLIRDGAEYEARVNGLFGDQFTGRADARMRSLNRLVVPRQITTDDDVEVLVRNLRHGASPWVGMM